MRARGGAAEGRGRAGRGRAGVTLPACCGEGDGKLAGLPEQEDLFQAGEQAGQAGHDQRVDRVRNPGAPLLCQRSMAQAGELVAEGEGYGFHGGYIANSYGYFKGKFRG